MGELLRCQIGGVHHGMDDTVLLLAVAVLQILYALISFGLLFAGTLQISANPFEFCHV